MRRRGSGTEWERGEGNKFSLHCNLSKTRNTGRDLAARNGVQSNRACQIIEHGRGYVVYVCAIHSFKRGENGMSVCVRVQLEGAWCTVSRSMIGKYITRVSGAKKKWRELRKQVQNMTGVLYTNTHIHIPSHSFIPFRSRPSLHIRHSSHKHTGVHTHTHTHTHTHAHSLTRMRSQARQPKRLQGLSCVPTIRASRADTAWQTKLTPRTSGACSSAQLPEHAM